ncbi:MAG TPA: protein kinase [Acidobacteriaceae bacterium]|nr:protein kinase [Acidobacteriaceae bacterium]
MPELKRNLSVGEVVAGDYKILGVAGAGGMGVVYRALDLKLERTVALKFLPPELVGNVSARHRILREARTACALDHPNIGVIHGIEDLEDGSSCIVMAFYDGETLSHRIHQNSIRMAEALGIAIQMAHGLADAHAHGVVHRDIKPSNVMLTSSGAVRIVDFGLASAATAETASQTGLTGTVAYMSPEQAMGHEVDKRTDIWALGCVLAEMLTGRSPFDRETIPAMIVGILNEPPRGLDDLPPGIQQVLYRMLAKNPAERYASCKELLPDLESLRTQIEADPNRATIKQTRTSPDVRKAREQASVSLWGATRPRRRRWLLPFSIAIAIVVVLAAAIPFIPSMRGRMFKGANTEAIKHIAVLPFENIGNNPENAVLVQGLMDSLAGRLSNLGSASNSLWVIPTSEVRRLSVSDPAGALSKLGATLAIEGSVQRDGQNVRLNLALVDTRTLRQIGSADVEDPTGDLSMLQDEALSKLAGLMNVSLNAIGSHGEGGSTNPAAYEDYLKALGYMQRWDKAGNLDLAVTSLQQAIQTDPHFALAYAQLGEAYRLKNSKTQDPRWLTEAAAQAQKGAEIDANIPEVYVTLGRIHDATGKHDLAMQEFQRALTLDPRNADAEMGVGYALESAGRIDESEAAFQKAAALRPDSWTGYAALGSFYDRQSKYSQAVIADQHAVDLSPDNAQALANLGGVYVDWDDPKYLPLGEQALRKSIQILPSYAAYANLGDLLLAEKRGDAAEAPLQQALKINAGDYNVWNMMMVSYQWQKKDADAADARSHAITLAEQTAKLQPSDVNAQSTLAFLYAQDKQNGNALARIQTSLALAPNQPDVLVNVAKSYENMGERTHALEYIEKALQKGASLGQIQDEPTLQGLLMDPALHIPHK